MPIDFSIQQQQMVQNASTTSASFAQAATGSLFGCAAQVVDSPMSLLADAAEEMTFAADTTDEFELQEREERDKVQESLSARVKMYQELMQQNGASEQINNLKDSIKSRAGKEYALRQARERFPDPSDAWAALQDIYDQLKEDPSVSKETLDGIREALETLDAEEGPAIRAGIQGALSAEGFGSLGDSGELGGLYRQAVLEFEDVNALYAHIQEKYGDDFDTALQFLYSALSNDLACDEPSMETTHLEHVNSNLGELRSLQSAHSLCSTLVDRWAGVHGVVSHDLDAMKLLGDIVALRKENFLGSYQINGIVEKAKAPDIERKVLFLQELLNTTRSFAPTLFDGNEGRMKVLDAVQEAVDQAITEEDEYLASLE